MRAPRRVLWQLRGTGLAEGALLFGWIGVFKLGTKHHNELLCRQRSVMCVFGPLCLSKTFIQTVCHGTSVVSALATLSLPLLPLQI